MSGLAQHGLRRVRCESLNAPQRTAAGMDSNKKRLVVLLASVLLQSNAVHALDNGIGLTPAMGFNTYQSPWSFQGGDALVIADALAATRLQAAGYTFVNSDCGWQSNKNG